MPATDQLGYGDRPVCLMGQISHSQYFKGGSSSKAQAPGLFKTAGSLRVQFTEVKATTEVLAFSPGSKAIPGILNATAMCINECEQRPGEEKREASSGDFRASGQANTSGVQGGARSWQGVGLPG
eukprot:317503-Pelagomonas_calceolata.AAC.3